VRFGLYYSMKNAIIISDVPKSLRATVIDLLRLMGYSYSKVPEDDTCNCFSANADGSICHSHTVSGWDDKQYWNIKGIYTVQEIDAFLAEAKRLKRVNKQVKLNNEYTAIVTKNGIDVGCINLPLSIIDDLIKARKEVLS
jgi:hypothetical protein